MILEEDKSPMALLRALDFLSCPAEFAGTGLSPPGLRTRGSPPPEKGGNALKRRVTSQHRNQAETISPSLTKWRCSKVWLFFSGSPRSLKKNQKTPKLAAQRYVHLRTDFLLERWRRELLFEERLLAPREQFPPALFAAILPFLVISSY